MAIPTAYHLGAAWWYTKRLILLLPPPGLSTTQKYTDLAMVDIINTYDVAIQGREQEICLISISPNLYQSK
jgi:hypothetical protein